MENKKQTAVEWLNQILVSKGIFFEYELYHQAKVMEKEQIMYAYVEGCSDSILDESRDKKRSEDYYNENYGK